MIIDKNVVAMYASKCLLYQYTKSLRPLNLHHGEALLLELSLKRKFVSNNKSHHLLYHYHSRSEIFTYFESIQDAVNPEHDIDSIHDISLYTIFFA